VLGVVLAGGRATRYDGKPKALELIGGVTIADRAIRALRQVAERVVLVANEPETYRPLGLETRPDLLPGLGALGGIHTAVAWAAEAGYRGALVTACDMPFLSAALLARLAEGAEEEEAVLPESDSRRGLEPLCAFYGSGCRPAIESAIARDDLRVVSFFPDVRVRTLAAAEVVRFGDPALLFLNVNTPADYRRAAAHASAGEPLDD
jgi:molybdopterin-guanine dinucleotide biosynthesis protein A